MELCKKLCWANTMIGFPCFALPKRASDFLVLSKQVQPSRILGHYSRMNNQYLSLTQSNQWLPEFRSTRSLLTLIVIAEVITVVVLIAVSTNAGQFWLRIGPASLLAQWTAMCIGVCLNLCKPSLQPHSKTVAVFVALLVVALSAFMAVLIANVLQRTILTYTNPSLGVDSAWRIALVATLIAAAGLRYSYVQQQWLQEMQSTAKAKIDALTARIRPHFLFNSMNTLASLISVDAAKAETVVEDLSALFRAALKADQAISLQEELELAEQYLAIEQLRLGKRLQISRQIELSEVARKLQVPALILQPLVENAIYHGIATLAEGGELVLRATCTDEYVELEVKNPIGSTPAKPENLSKGNGMAIENIRARLRLAFGDRAQLTLANDASSNAVANRAFHASLRLPLSHTSLGEQATRQKSKTL
jgi:two-component system, LytTR family, sensor histidine kinase AlgZ